MFHHSYTLSKNHDIRIIRDISKVDLLNEQSLQFKQIFPLECSKKEILLEEGHHRIRFYGELYKEELFSTLPWIILYVIILCEGTRNYIFRESIPQNFITSTVSDGFAGSFQFDCNINITKKEKLNFLTFVVSKNYTLTPIILKKMNIIIQSPKNIKDLCYYKYKPSLFKTVRLYRDWSGYELYDTDLNQINRDIKFQHVFGNSVYFKKSNSDKSYFQILKKGYYKIELSGSLKITFKDIDKEDINNFSYFIYIFVYLKLNSHKISIKKVYVSLDFISSYNVMLNLVHERKFFKNDKLKISLEIIPFIKVRKTYINSVSMLSSKTSRFIHIYKFGSSISEGLLKIDHIYSIVK